MLPGRPGGARIHAPGAGRRPPLGIAALFCVLLLGCLDPTDSGEEPPDADPVEAPGYLSLSMGGMDLSSSPEGQPTEISTLTALRALRDTIKIFKGWNPATGKWDRDQHDPFPHLCRVLPDGSTRYIMHNSSVVHIWRQYTRTVYYNDTEVRPSLHQADSEFWVNNTDVTVGGNDALPGYPWFQIINDRYAGTLRNWTTEISTGEDISWSYRANRLMGGAADSDKLADLRRVMGYTEYQAGSWLGLYDSQARIRQKFSYDAYQGGQNGHFTRTIFSMRYLSPPGSATSYATVDAYNLDWSKPMVFDGVIPVYVYLTYIKRLHGVNHWNSLDTPPDAWATVTGYKRLSSQSLTLIDEILELIEGKNNYGPDILNPYDRYSLEAAARRAQYGIRDCSLFEIYDELYFGPSDQAIGNIGLGL